MDHIPLVHGYRDVEVPFVCEAYPYDGYEFARFPERKGFSSEEEIKRGNFGVATPGETVAFLQAWLFFGVLSEVFDSSGIKVDVGDFVRGNDVGEQIVTISRLLALDSE
jgi:hypothetical protein